MKENVILILVLLAALSMLVLAVWWVVVPLFRGVPAVPSGRKIAEAMVAFSGLKSGETAYDLGSGFGHITHAAAATGARAIGYEREIPAHLFAHFFKRGEARRGDFFTADLTDADVFFTYLFPNLMQRISTEIWPTLKPGTRLVSHAFPLPNIPPTRQKTAASATLFLYVKA